MRPSPLEVPRLQRLKFKMPRLSRHLARVIALQTLFALETHGGETDAVLAYIAAEHAGKSPDIQFARELLKGVATKRREIRELIERYAPAWPVDKISSIDRAILEIGVFEIAFGGDVPPIVAIDESIELAKAFGSDNSQKFINGVLNALLNANRPSGETKSA